MRDEVMNGSELQTLLAQCAQGAEQSHDVQRLFTPHFAAPEQVADAALSEASDVFGLGALAYRLLSGRLLFENSRRAVNCAYSVLNEDVEAPSGSARAIGGAPGWV